MAHDHDCHCCGKGMSRRELLRKLGQAALAPAALLAAGEARAATRVPLAPLPGVPLVRVFRLSAVAPGQKARRSICCNACHQHARYKYFATAEAANRLRAHKGCNCVIVAEQIPLRDFNAMFLPGTRFARPMFDLRWR